MKNEKSRVVGGVVVPNSTVETPAHIAELMRGLVGVNKDSVLYDPCAGRGNLIKDAGCTTIAVEQEAQFKQDLDKVADVVIIDSCFNVDEKRIADEIKHKQLKDEAKYESLVQRILKLNPEEARSLLYEILKSNSDADWYEPVKQFYDEITAKTTEPD